MKDRLEPLIAERAPWLARPGWPTGLARRLLERILRQDEAAAFARTLEPLGPRDIMDTAARALASRVEIAGADNLPHDGPALIVANHPTGIADGIMLWHAIAACRPDAFFYANSDILRVLPQMHEIIVPVEWRLEKRTHARTRETMALTRAALEAGRLGVIFPSGRLAKRRGLTLHERPWMTSAAMLARRFDLPVIPVNIRARNSALFYLFDLVHPTLRDITLFHETLNKAGQPFAIRFGRPLPARSLPASAAEATVELRRATLGLATPGRLPLLPRRAPPPAALRA